MRWHDAGALDTERRTAVETVVRLRRRFGGGARRTDSRGPCGWPRGGRDSAVVSPVQRIAPAQSLEQRSDQRRLLSATSGLSSSIPGVGVHAFVGRRAATAARRPTKELGGADVGTFI